MEWFDLSELPIRHTKVDFTTKEWIHTEQQTPPLDFTDLLTIPLSFSPLGCWALWGGAGHCPCHYKTLPVSLPPAALGCPFASDPQVWARAAAGDKVWAVMQKADALEWQRLLLPAAPASGFAAGGLFPSAIASESWAQPGGEVAAAAAAVRARTNLSVEKQD